MKHTAVPQCSNCCRPYTVTGKSQPAGIVSRAERTFRSRRGPPERATCSAAVRMRTFVLFRLREPAGEGATRNWCDHVPSVCSKFCIGTSFVDVVLTWFINLGANFILGWRRGSTSVA